MALGEPLSKRKHSKIKRAARRDSRGIGGTSGQRRNAGARDGANALSAQCSSPQRSYRRQELLIWARDLRWKSMPLERTTFGRASGRERYCANTLQSTTVQPFAFCLIERLVEFSDVRGAIVGPFPLGIGVVHEARESSSGTSRCPFQHLQVAVGVSEREDRASAYEAVDADGFARAIVDELDPGLLHEHGFAVGAHANFDDPGGAHYLFRRNAVDLLDPRPHELDAAASTMKVLKLLARR